MVSPLLKGAVQVTLTLVLTNSVVRVAIYTGTSTGVNVTSSE